MHTVFLRRQQIPHRRVAPRVRSITWRTTARNVLDLWNSQKFKIGYSRSTMNNDERMQRESSLIAAIRKELPEFAKACADDTEMVLLHQDAYAADYEEDEYTLLDRLSSTLRSVGKKCV
jgi:hypothetical protein